MSRIKVLIVDDNFVARRGLRSFLESENDFEIVGEASSGNTAVKFVKEVETDAVLMDIRMPDTDGINATIQIANLKPRTKIIMLTVLEDQATILKALLAGAKGYLTYGHFTPDELLDSIRRVLQGETIAIPKLTPALMNSIQSHLASLQNVCEHENMEPLTTREKEILGFIALGKGNKEIADTLGVEEKTVKNHINNIYSKLQIKSRYEAISYVFNCSGLDLI